ncbi:hypothetical protein SLS60_008353 [Paraconiothyrium brasiliense]|uniref:Uncharacterized protein n=1 Tax=Paraconiothyrium brasiliense TaxID=300254 RepID=A0ABR3R0C2_9PLEO
MDLANVPATTGVASIRSLVRGYDLEAALDCLPSAAELTITPQTDVPSEHPFKLLIGTRYDDRVWIGLTTTPKRASGPGFKIFITTEDTITSHTVDVLDNSDLVQPFRRLWEKTSMVTGTVWHGGHDTRRGMLKSFAYWYLLIEAERIGRKLLVPDSIRRYLVEGLKMVGVEAYSVEETVLGENVSTKEHDLRKERDTFKRQHPELFEDEEQEPKRRSRRIKQAHMDEQEAGQDLSSTLPSSSSSTSEGESDASGGYTDSDLQTRKKACNFPRTSGGIRSLMMRFPRPHQQVPPQQYSNPWPAASKRPKGRQVTSHGTSGVEIEAGSDYPNVDFEDGDNAFTPALQGPSQGHEHLPGYAHPSPSTSMDGVTQIENFENLKELMAADTALHTEYQYHLAKAEALKRQLEEHRDTIGKVMAKAVAARKK